VEILTRWDIFIACFGATTPLIAVLLGLHIQNRSDKKKSDRQLESMLEEYGFHDHNETTGPLYVHNIRRPRAGRGR
jgi:hypothetical protein